MRQVEYWLVEWDDEQGEFCCWTFSTEQQAQEYVQSELQNCSNITIKHQIDTIAN